LVPYTGFLEGRSGAASVTFLIYKDELGGEPLWTETQTVSVDALGHFKTQLGAASPNGLPSELFSSGEARWLEVQVAGQGPQARVLLASVPYALKAGDSATLGGLPASAFALAGGRAGAVAGVAGVSPQVTSTVTTTGGTAGYLPEFSGSSTIVDSPLLFTGTAVSVGSAASPTNLDVSGGVLINGGITVDGGATYNGQLLLPALGTATAATGYGSQFFKMYTSAWNSSTQSTVPPRFQWQAEVTGNNTASPSATLNLLASSTSTPPTETGFHFNANGTMTFAPGQTFPGAGGGTITGVTAGTALTGGGTSGTVTLNVDTTKVPLLSGSNSFAGNQSVAGNITATGSETAQGQGSFGAGGAATVGVSGTGISDGVIGQATGSANNSAGVSGTETAKTGLVYGVTGTSNSTTTFSVGVNGYEAATSGQVFGVQGSTNSSTNYAAGVSGYEGSTSGAVFGVTGGTSSSTNGAAGVSGNAGALTGTVSGVAGAASSTSANAAGVSGYENALSGQVFGVAGSTNSTGNGAAGVSGYEGGGSGQVFGVTGSTNSSTNYAAGVNGYEGATTGTVFGVTGGTNSPNGIGVNGSNNSTTGGTGVQGFANATSGYAVGVSGITNSPNGDGVSGVNASGKGGSGVYGSSMTTGALSFGVQGVAGPGGVGVQGSSPNVAVAGFTIVCSGPTCLTKPGTAGQFVTATGGLILQGISGPGGDDGSERTEMFHVDASGNGYFAGNLEVTGKVSKGSGSFKIDDPLDPANKYLSHSFVESPDMMNVYNGNVTTDKFGRATVELPEYFESLNRDFRYELTVMGQFAQAIVATKVGATKIGHNRFVIRTNKPSVEVSWQVTGIRKDAYANANRIPVEEAKPEGERGYYLHPEAFGEPSSKGIVAAHSSGASSGTVALLNSGGRP
jgi:hypothetical protein